MRSGHLDFDTGKWIDDPTPEEDPDPPEETGVAGKIAIKVNGKTKHLRYFETAPTVADKARSIQQRRKAGG